VRVSGMIDKTCAERSRYMMMQIMGDFDGRQRTVVKYGRKTKSVGVLVLFSVLLERCRKEEIWGGDRSTYRRG